MFEQKKEKELIKLGFLGGLIEAFYCFLVALFMFNANTIIPNMNGALGVSLMLILLVISAGISGILVVGLPAILVVQKRYKEAVKVLATALTTLFVIFLIFFSIAIIVFQ